MSCLTVLAVLCPLLPLVVSWSGGGAAGGGLCPRRCLCYETSDLVDCKLRRLGRVPPDVPHGTWLLELSGNALTELRTGAFTGLWALRILIMANNSIRALQPQALSALSFLERLDLSYNRLRRLPADFSHSLLSLQDLRLDHNLLERLDLPALAHFENLRKLDLSHNRIGSMEVGAFRGLLRLRHLNLRGNRLNALREGTLTRQQGLEVLLLGHNNISAIDVEALAPLRSLSLLALEGNQLRHLKFKTFLNLYTISTHLQLSANPWTCDCDLYRVFSKILHVRHLHVDDYGNVTCREPPQLEDVSLAWADSQLCAVETGTVMVISGTVMLTVVGALVMAERKRKKRARKMEAARRESRAPALAVGAVRRDSQTPGDSRRESRL